MNNDEKLWQGLQLGDREMFLALYKKYYHTLLFIGLKEMKDAQLVKDAIHQLFLYLWEKRETIDDARDIKSYLVTSLLRKLITDWKRSKRTGELQVVWSNNSDEPQLNPEEKLIVKDHTTYLNMILSSKIKELPSRQKELIELRFYEGLNYEEIVSRTGLSHRTVYNKIYEGIKKLKAEIAGSEYSKTAIFS